MQLSLSRVQPFRALRLTLIASVLCCMATVQLVSARSVAPERSAPVPASLSGSVAQEAYLKAANTQASDVFGVAVAIDADTLVIGAPGEDSGTSGVNSVPNETASNAGAVYVFVRSGTTWTQQAYLKASNTGAGDRFGSSLAIAGDTIVVGAGVEDSGSTGVNSTPNDSATDAGAAYVFVRSGTTWSQQAYLKAANTGANDRFGSSVSIADDTLVIAAQWEDSGTSGVNSTPNEGAPDAGAAYVFVRSGTVWSQQAYLKASNTGSMDRFGSGVSIAGDRIVVGAYTEDSSTTGGNSTPNEGATDAGAAYVFGRSGTVWSQHAYLKASNTGAGDAFGASVAISGDRIVVGAAAEDSGSTGVNSTPNDSATNAGAAYVFGWSGTTWSQQAYLKASNSGALDGFGYSVAISGDHIVAGAWQEDSSSVTPNEAAVNAGAAYVFAHDREH
jgi:hypothetical protein